MQFIVTARDGAGMLERRMEVRPRHLANMEQVPGTVVCAGGLLDEAGQMCGSVLVLDLPGRAELDAYLASEPYIAEGVWESVQVDQMNVVIVGGEKVGT